MADMRYTFIEEVCAESVVKGHQSKESLRSVKIDSVLTHKYLAIPIFLGIMIADFLADLWRDRPGSQRLAFFGNRRDNQFNGSRPDCSTVLIQWYIV